MKLDKFATNLILGAFVSTAMLAAAAPVDAVESDKYKEVAVADGGMVKGKVSFEGAVPADAIEKILITKNTDVCGKGEREVAWVDVKDGALRGAFVFLDKVKEGKKWAQPEFGTYLVNQKGCRFHPWAQVVRPGPIIIRNSDAGVLHNINARELIGVEKGRVVKKTLFNFGQPDPGDISDKIEPRRSSYIGINCEAHNFMFGFILAPTHPYAVVVGEDGAFSLDNIPPGKYTLKAWHPRFGVQKAKITVAAKGMLETNFTFSKAK
ncbi:MAG: carboxypeptidase-like regulatory domain-containing protein [Proteobacteria bacterium]|nr:carboxypeptidase-like regulatory domain-containing protein [Pseudomonadota bacterium]